MRVLLLSAIFVSAAAAQTYSREVSRILLEKCRICHRPNDIAPFAMESYADVASRGDLIRHAVASGRMPPWKPVAGHGEFRDSYALTEEERLAILGWIDAGMPEGDPADLPEAPAAASEWPLGEPDLVLEMAQEYTPESDRDIYRCFVLPSGTAEDRFVSAVEVLPGNRRTVHHALLFVDVSGEAEKLDAADEAPGYTCFGGPGIPLGFTSGLGGWAPGMRARHLPEGIGLPLPAGARIVMQLHYHPDGDEPAPDRTRVGLYFSKQPVEHRLIWLPVVNMTFEIPAGAPRHEVRGYLFIPPFFDAKAILVAPHMHLLGREIKLEVEKGGETRPLVYIDNWDFEWQGVYAYKEPVELPGFSLLRLTCTYDNSQGLSPIRWGEGTADEMCLAFLGVTLGK